MPNKFSTFLVSTLCIFAGSTDSIGVASLTGIVWRFALQLLFDVVTVCEGRERYERAS